VKKIKKNMKCKEKILVGALELFVERGFDGTSIASIVKHTGVSNGAMYHHFGSKEELINEVFFLVHKVMKEEMLGVLKDSMDIREKFYAIWSIGIRWALNNPEKKRFLNMFSNSPYMEKLWTRSVTSQFNFLCSIFDEANKSEIIVDMDADYLLCHMKSSSDAMALYLRLHPEKYSEVFLKNSFKTFWRSIINI